MPNKGDKLDATIECPACGGQACMSVTKNYTVFAYCKEIVDEESGEKCGYRGFLGRKKSREILKQIKQHEGEKHAETINEQKTGQPDAEPEPRDEPAGGDDCAEREPERGSQRGGGVGAALTHFFTGDD